MANEVVEQVPRETLKTIYNRALTCILWKKVTQQRRQPEIINETRVYKTRKCSKYNVEQPLQFIEDSKISNNAHHTTRPEKNVGEKSIYQDDPMLSRKRDDDKVLRDSIKVV